MMGPARTFKEYGCTHGTVRYVGLNTTERDGVDGVETISRGIYFNVWSEVEARLIRIFVPSAFIVSCSLIYDPPSTVFTRALTAVASVGILCLYFFVLGWRQARDLATTQILHDGAVVIVNHGLAPYPWQGSDRVTTTFLDIPTTDQITFVALTGREKETEGNDHE